MAKRDSIEKENKKSEGDDRRLSIRDAVNRFFDDDFWIEPFDLWRSPRRLASRMNREIFPRIDITETDNDIRVTADIPGVDPDNIDIYVEGNRMRISGKVDHESETQEGEKPYRYERTSGEFRREFVLPSRVSEDGVRAVCKDGVLTVTLPKIEEDRKKRIKIERQ